MSDGGLHKRGERTFRPRDGSYGASLSTRRRILDGRMGMPTPRLAPWRRGFEIGLYRLMSGFYLLNAYFFWLPSLAV